MVREELFDKLGYLSRDPDKIKEQTIQIYEGRALKLRKQQCKGPEAGTAWPMGRKMARPGTGVKWCWRGSWNPESWEEL